MKIRNSYTYDDMLLRPKYSPIRSRKNVDMSITLGKGFIFGLPVVSSNMKTVSEIAMSRKLAELGGLPILHRFATNDEILNMYKESSSGGLIIGASIGIKESDKLLADQLVNIGCKIICIDVAHAHQITCLEMTEWFAKKYPNVLLIVGNVATDVGAFMLYNHGADVIKVNIGSSGICSTRIETGAGVASMTALEEVFHASLINKDDVYGGRKFRVIADGGLSKVGNIVKALCFSDAVMLGNMLAGTDEAPGEMSEINGMKYKEYSGSSTHKTDHIEGVKALVPYKGPVENVIKKIRDGLSSGMSYQGVKNLEELKFNPEFELITNAGLIESGIHDVKVI